VELQTNRRLTWGGFFSVYLLDGYTVVSIVKGCFEIKKHLKGEKPTNVKDAGEGSVSIKNKDGNVVVVGKGATVVLNNPRADDLVSSVSRRAIEHNPDGGYSICAGGETANFNPSDADAIARNLPIDKTTRAIKSEGEGDLLIRNVPFVGRAKWRFTTDKRTFDASIEDDTFLDSFHDGLFPIRPDDFVTATYQVVTEVNEAGMELPETAKYTITRIHNGIKHNFSAAQTRIKGV